jgi:hypothetical protein
VLALARDGALCPSSAIPVQITLTRVIIHSMGPSFKGLNEAIKKRAEAS